MDLIIFNIVILLVVGTAFGQKESGVKSEPHPIYDFARNLYLTTAELRVPDENLLLSPFSIRSIMALVYLASKGKTSREIMSVMHFPQDHEQLIEGLKRQIASAHKSTQSKYDIANGLFLKQGSKLASNFSNILKNDLKGDVSKVDFSSPEDAAKLINDWVTVATRNGIKKIIDPVQIGAQSSLFLANALYFSGQWDKPFITANSSESLFQVSPTEQVEVPMMLSENTFGYSYLPKLEATGIIIPFKDPRFEFVIVKPDESLAKLEYLLEEYPLQTLTKEIKKNTRNVIVQMPKFKLGVSSDLTGVMRKLGIKKLFTQRAEVPLLTEDGEKNFVSNLFHETRLEVDEKGATASAGTIIGVYPISAPSVFLVNKPFLFLLNDRLTGPVFLGRLNNPLK